MRLLYIVSKITDSGGVSSVLSHRLNYLADVLGFQIYIYSTNDTTSSPFFSFSDKITLHLSDLKMKSPLSLFRFKSEINRCVKNFKPNVVCVADNGFKSLLIKSIIPKHISCIYELHAQPNYFYGEEYKEINKKIVQFFISKFLPKFDKIVTLKNVSANYLSQSNVVVIPNPITIKVSETASLNNNKVIAIGRLEEVKNFKNLIAIWKEVVKKHTNYVLEIYGEGSQLQSLNCLIENYNLQHQIKILNPVKNVEKVYAKSDVFLLTSKSESFSLVTLEAMACGLPVMSFAIEMDHLIKDGKNGFLVPDSQTYIRKLSHLLDDINLRKKLGAESLQLASNFTLEKHIAKWLDLLENKKRL